MAHLLNYYLRPAVCRSEVADLYLYLFLNCFYTSDTVEANFIYVQLIALVTSFAVE